MDSARRLRVVIVDDEPLARRELRRLLAEHGDVDILAEAAAVEEALDAVSAGQPDVVLLDIKLGRRSGLEVVPQLDPQIAVIFVTAWSDFAVRAFELNALDYLVKPVEPSRLAAALQRVRARHASGTPASGATSSDDAQGARELTPQDWVFLRSAPAAFIEVQGIVCVLADGDSSIVCTADGATRRSGLGLTRWEAQLPGSVFLRVHRSTIVNLRRVSRVVPWSNHGYLVHLDGYPEPVTMSRRYAARVRDRLGR